MNEHSQDSMGAFDEPEGGWETAPTLIDTELVVTTLCRFVGLPVGHLQPCLFRTTRRHPDEECRALYIQADALRAGLDLGGFDEIPEEVRRPFVGDEPSGRPHD